MRISKENKFTKQFFKMLNEDTNDYLLKSEIIDLLKFIYINHTNKI